MMKMKVKMAFLYPMGISQKMRSVILMVEVAKLLFTLVIMFWMIIEYVYKFGWCAMCVGHCKN